MLAVINKAKTIISSEVFRFLMAGFVAASVNYSSRFLFDIWLTFEQSVVLAYLTGMVVAFFLMRNHVFNNKKTLARQAISFSIVNVLAIIQTLVVSVFLSDWLSPRLSVVEYRDALAHLGGVLTPVISSYFGHKYFTFK